MTKSQNKTEKVYEANWIRSNRLGYAIAAFILGIWIMGSTLTGTILFPLVFLAEAGSPSPNVAFLQVGLLSIIAGGIVGYLIFWVLNAHYPATSKCPYCGREITRDGHKGWSVCPKCKKHLEWHL